MPPALKNCFLAVTVQYVTTYVPQTCELRTWLSKNINQTVECRLIVLTYSTYTPHHHSSNVFRVSDTYVTMNATYVKARILSVTTMQVLPLENLKIMYVQLTIVLYLHVRNGSPKPHVTWISALGKPMLPNLRFYVRITGSWY